MPLNRRLPYRLFLAVPAAIALAVMALAAPAQAGYRELLLDACGRDGKVNGTYSQADYRKALANIPTDADQYSDCRAILRAAQLGAASGVDQSTPAAAADVVDNASPKEKAAVDDAATGSTGAPVQVGASFVQPASFGAGRQVAATVSGLPTPLLVALGLIAAGALAALATAIVARVRNRSRP